MTRRDTMISDQTGNGAAAVTTAPPATAPPATAPPATALEAKPVIGDFEYRVLVQVYLPIQYAELLRERAIHHYDWHVRDCGNHGAINGLRNIALWTTEREPGEDPPLPHALTDDDIQTAMKAMEQAVPGDDRKIADEVWRILHDALKRVNHRWRELNGVE